MANWDDLVADNQRLRQTIRTMARKLGWWTWKINHESADEDVVADAGNDYCHAKSVLRGIGADDDWMAIEKSSSQTEG